MDETIAANTNNYTIEQTETKEKSDDEFQMVTATMLRMFRHASSIAMGRGAHNKVAMRERVRWSRIACDLGSHLLERDILDKYKRKRVGQSKEELLALLSEGKIKFTRPLNIKGRHLEDLR